MSLERKDAEIQWNYSGIQMKDIEIQHLTTALHDKDVMLETLRSDKQTISHSLPKRVSKPE